MTEISTISNVQSFNGPLVVGIGRKIFHHAADVITPISGLLKTVSLKQLYGIQFLTNNDQRPDPVRPQDTSIILTRAHLTI
jgi:hypothetical protein